MPAPDLDVPLERDVFLRSLIRELAGVLEGVIGLEETSGFISLVGQRIGEQINDSYKSAYGDSRFSPEQVSEVLVDLKARIKGEFELVERTPDTMVFRNCACPFAEKVVGRTSMCMMTSNVFGHIAADHLGYAKVELDQTIAKGDPQCRVVVHLRQTAETDAVPGREYYGEMSEP